MDTVIDQYYDEQRAEDGSLFVGFTEEQKVEGEINAVNRYMGMFKAQFYAWVALTIAVLVILILICSGKIGSPLMRNRPNECTKIAPGITCVISILWMLMFVMNYSSNFSGDQHVIKQLCTREGTPIPKAVRAWEVILFFLNVLLCLPFCCCAVTIVSS